MGNQSSSPASAQHRLETISTESYRRTGEIWRAHEGEFPTWPCKYSILYGPPRFRPSLFFIGANPGFKPGVDDAQPEERSWPISLDYEVADYRLARNLRALFGRELAKQVFPRAMGANLLFFKSRCLGKDPEFGLGWGDNPLHVRRTLSSFSRRELKLIIEAAEPRAFLALGLSVFDQLADGEDTQAQSGLRRVTATGSAFGRPLFGIIHPSGAHISKPDRLRIADFLANDLAPAID